MKKQAKSKRGGRRPGSGRKPKAFHAERQALVDAFEAKNVEFLARAFENLVKLANGGFERVEEEWAPNPKRESDPHAPAEVLVKRKVSFAEPDRGANAYLIDRQLGRPKRAVEVSGPNGSPVPVSVEEQIGKVYGERPPGV